MVRLNDSVLMSRMEDEVILLDTDSSKYYELNAVGSRILELLTESRNLETAISRAEREFDASEKCIRKDIFALLNAMIEQGLVKEYAV